MKIVLKKWKIWNSLLSWSSYDKLFKMVLFGPWWFTIFIKLGIRVHPKITILDIHQRIMRIYERGSCVWFMRKLFFWIWSFQLMIRAQIGHCFSHELEHEHEQNFSLFLTSVIRASLMFVCPFRCFKAPVPIPCNFMEKTTRTFFKNFHFVSHKRRFAMTWIIHFWVNYHFKVWNWPLR